MTYRETGYIGSEPTFAECLSLINSNVEGTDDTHRKPSPSNSVMSERGTYDGSFKRDDCMADSVRSSLSGQSDTCNSPPQKQPLPTSNSNLQLCRTNGFSVPPHLTGHVGPTIDDRSANVYQKAHSVSNEHKSTYFQANNAIRKFSDYRCNNAYSDPSGYPGQFASPNNFEQRSYVNNHVDSSSSMYSLPVNYPGNEFLYGASAQEVDPTNPSYISRNSVNEYPNHQGALISSTGMFHANNRIISKDGRDGMTQDYSWMREKKLGKKVHDSRRKLLVYKHF